MSFPWAEQYQAEASVHALAGRPAAAAAPRLQRGRRRLSGAAQPQLFLEFRRARRARAGASRSSPASSWRCITMPIGRHGAFASVEHIMRDVNRGWFLRYAHANGASFFFIVTYIHIFRGLYYGSYKAPREMVWMLGLVIFLLMMATAFMGYVLPWGQMSFWAAKVITGLFGAIPLVGEPIQNWLLGGYAPDQATLTRFFSLHYLLPFVIAGVVILHIWALHIPGSGNPTGVDVKTPQDTVPFHPYYTAKDGFGAGALPAAARGAGLLPAQLSRPCRTITSRPTRSRRPRISCPNGISGRSTRSCAPSPSTSSCRPSCGACWRCSRSILLLFFLPWLDKSPVRSGTYRPMFRMFFWILVARRAGARLLRRHAGGRALCDDQPGRDDLLFRALPDHPADPVDGRKDAAAAQFDLGKRAARRGGGSRPPISARRAGQSVRGRRRHGSHSRHPGRPRLRRRRRLVAALGRDRRIVEEPPEATVEHRFHEHAARHRTSRSTARSAASTAQQLQRGFQVYKEVCAGCHGLNYVAFRNLHDLGYSEAEVRAIADQWPIQVPSINPETGEPATRKAIPADRFPSPYAERDRRPRRQQQCAAARSVADRQGAARRRAPMSTRC